MGCQYGFYTCSFIGEQDFCNSCDGGQNYQMKEKEISIFTYIKAAQFFPKYAPLVVDWKRKLSGKNSNGNPLDFTESDKVAIRNGIKEMVKHLKTF